jgi:hypothetical protein
MKFCRLSPRRRSGGHSDRFIRVRGRASRWKQYHKVLRNSCARSKPQAPGDSGGRSLKPSAASGFQSGVEAPTSDPGETKKKRSCQPRNYSWATLMERVFEGDVLACPRCGGRMRILAAIDSPDANRAASSLSRDDSGLLTSVRTDEVRFSTSLASRISVRQQHPGIFARWQYAPDQVGI